MIQSIVFCLLWQALSGYEHYCIKETEATAPTNWADVEKLMNDPNSPVRKYKFEPSLTPTLSGKCKEGDIVIVRRYKVDIASKKATRSLHYLTGDNMKRFMEEGGFCHMRYDESSAVKEVDYYGKGDLSENYVLLMCGYREVQCGDHVYKFSREKYDVWCKYSVKANNWTAMFTAKPLFKVYDDDLYCEIGDRSDPYHVVCLREKCSREVEGEARAACGEKRRIQKRKYKYTRQASQWGHEAFKHFFRNYIITFIFYCYFMLQARRSPMVRRELTASWKAFKSGIDLKDDDESTLLEQVRRREKFLYDRHKRELKLVKKVPVENLHEELGEAKEEISRQAALVKEAEEGEAVSNRPPNMSTGSRLVQKEPCSHAHLKGLIQWSWMIESHMIRTMKELDHVDMLRKSYGLDATTALSKLV